MCGTNTNPGLTFAFLFLPGIESMPCRFGSNSGRLSGVDRISIPSRSVGREEGGGKHTPLPPQLRARINHPSLPSTQIPYPPLPSPTPLPLYSTAQHPSPPLQHLHDIPPSPVLSSSVPSAHPSHPPSHLYTSQLLQYRGQHKRRSHACAVHLTTYSPDVGGGGELHVCTRL